MRGNTQHLSFPDWFHSPNVTTSSCIYFPANGTASSFFVAEKFFDPRLRYAAQDPSVNLICNPGWPQTYTLPPWRNIQMNADAVSSVRPNDTASLRSPLGCLHLRLRGGGPASPGSEAVLQRREEEPVLGLLLRQLSPWTTGILVPGGNPWKQYKTQDSELSHQKGKRAGEFVKVTSGDTLLSHILTTRNTCSQLQG